MSIEKTIYEKVLEIKVKRMHNEIEAKMDKIFDLERKFEAIQTKVNEELKEPPKYDWQIQREQAFKEIKKILEE